MTEKFTYDVFISYSSQDKAIVHSLAERLRDDGVNVWLDDWVLKPGDPISLKIQHGLEQSRVLLMCMSNAYFASDWATLEHHTLLFRDPTNEQRRFVPLLLEDCERPDVIAQFLHIDWRVKGDSAYAKLLNSCSQATLDEVTFKQPKGGVYATSNKALIATLSVHPNIVESIVMSPDGNQALLGSSGGTVKIWDLKSQQLVGELDGHSRPITSVAISPDGKRALSGSRDRTLKVWDLKGQQLIGELDGHSRPITSVAISPDGKRALSGSSDSALKVWDFEGRQLIGALEGHTSSIKCVAISPDCLYAISGSSGGTLKVWDLKDLKLIGELEGHIGQVTSVVITKDGKRAISGLGDSTLKIWDLVGQRPLIGILEGHLGPVTCVAISPDGSRAISGSEDRTLKIWDLERRQLIGNVYGHARPIKSVAISPDGQRVISGSDDCTLRIWDLAEFEAAAPSADTERYTNAKVVLVGESGVGKSGLALRLSENDWRETGSTHGMSVTKLDLPNDPAVPAEREVWLWDFAGQPDYRLIHQLYMDETALAMMVVDPQKDEPFAPLGHWEQALARAVKHDPAKLLVAARCDRGGYVVGQRDIDAYLEGRGYAGHVNTAAKLADDSGCVALKEMIAEHIPWDRLPSTSTTVLFKALKDAVIAIKESGIVLIRVVELEQRLRLGWTGEPFEDRDLRTVIGLLTGQGLVQPLDFGDFVLLQPEQINNYGSAVVRAARECESELAELPERAVLEGEIDFKDMERLKEEDEKILLRAVLQTFLDRSLCYRVETPEGARLVFPAYFKFERPSNPDQPQVKVTYGFAGPIDEIYTTLVVRLHYSNEFQSDRLWRYAADYNAFAGGAAGLMLTKENDTTAKMQAYFGSEAGVDTEVLFIKYIHEHLKRYAEDVTRVRDYICPHCNTTVENKKSIARKLSEGKTDIICVECEERVPLIDMIEEKFASDQCLLHVRKMDEQAQIRLDNESLELILVGHAFSTVGEAGHIFRSVPNSDWGIDGEIEFRNDKGKACGNRAYLQLTSSGNYRRRVGGDRSEVIEIEDREHAERWQASDHPVMMAVRDADGKIRWMNVTEYLKAHGAKKPILFDGEPFTAINVHKMWQRLTQ